MMQQTLTPIAPETQAALQLAQGIQRGAVAPMTPEGQPTVVGRMLQQVAPQPATPPMAGGMPPGLPQMRQNAGIASQIDMMEKQKAQQAMMQQAEAMANARRTAPVLGGGIAMAPGAQGMRMAEGGIVGYAGAGAVVAPDYSAAEAMRKQGLGAFEKYETEPPAPAAVGTQAGATVEERNKFLRSQGVDPEFLIKEMEAARALNAKRVALEEERAREAKARMQERGLIAFLTSASGRNPFASAVAGGQESDAAMRGAIQRYENAAIAAQEAGMKEQRELQLARQATAMGDWKAAQEHLAKAQEARNVRALEEGKARMQAAGQMGQEATSAAQIAAQIRGQDKTLEAARIGAAAREGGIGGKAVNMALTRLQSNPDYKKAADEIARYEAYPESIRNTSSAKARLQELYAKQKALETAVESAFDLQPGTIALALRNMGGAGAGAGAGPAVPSMLDTLPPGVTVKRIQ